MGDISRAAEVKAIQPFSILVVRATIESMEVASDPILILSIEGSDAHWPAIEEDEGFYRSY